ncbi:MAG: pseudouridine synthase [Candidatus Omnitrophica bacterium]|nr:pseudouridine synthase [Candidatus Omnitrophota bacterium]
MKEGAVTVNGKVVTEPWFRVGTDDTVKARGRILRLEKSVYLVFNKPKGVTVTLEDQFAESKIVDFIPKRFGRVYPVGRLDKPSRGLIILTNDGEACYRLTHPKFEVEKEYLVSVKGFVDDKGLAAIRRGVREGDDFLKVKQAYIEHADKAISKIRVIVCEGKKRHLRRLFEELGFDVVDLLRIRIGALTLEGLKEGRFRVVDKDEIYAAISGRRIRRKMR